MECEFHGTGKCPAERELDSLDEQINMRLKAESELKTALEKIAALERFVSEVKGIIL